MKKLSVRPLCLLLAVCLLISMVFPSPMVWGQATSDASGSEGTSTMPGEDTTTSTEPTAETKPKESSVYVQSVKRAQEGFTTKARYEILLGGSFDYPFTVMLTDANGKELFMMPGMVGQHFATISANGEYTITVTDVDGLTATTTFTEDKIDTDAPVIVKLPSDTDGKWQQERLYIFTVTDSGSGVNTVTLTCGENAPVDLTANDDGTYRVNVDSNMDYTITAVDELGNATELVITEDHIDFDAPVITMLTDSAEGKWQLSREYSFTAIDELSGIASITIQTEGGEVVALPIRMDGNYTITADANTSYVVTAVDMAGNSTTITIVEAYLDLEAPSMTEPVRSHPNWATKVDYTFTATDLGSGIDVVEVKLNGKQISVEKLADDSYRFTTEENGTYTVTVVDKLGHKTEIPVNEVRIDHDAPVISGIQTQNVWASEQNTVTMTITDKGELENVTITDVNGTVCPFDFSGSVYTLMVKNNGIYTVTATDKAGNVVSETFTVDHIDTEAPSKPDLNAFGTGEWVNVDIDLFASSNDTQSGIAAYWYSTESSIFDAATWTKMDLLNGLGMLRLTEDQVKTYYVVAEDHVGRISDVAQVKVSIDKTPSDDLSVKYVTTENSGFLREVDGRLLFVDKLTFTAKANDTSSGIVRYEYRVVGASGSDTGWISVDAGSDGFTETFSGNEDIYTICVRVYDRAGNCSAEFVTSAVMLENTHTDDAQRNPAPDVVLQTDKLYDGSWTNQSITILVSGSTAVSGIEFYEYRVDHADPAIADTDWAIVPVVDGKAQLVADADTNATYYFRAVSYAGNRTLDTSRIVRVQKTAPNAAALSQDKATGVNGWYTVIPGYQVHLPVQNSYFAPVQYIITYTHNGKDMGQVVYDGTNAPKISADGLWSFRITSLDAAGNATAVVASNADFSVDTKAPDQLSVTMDDNSILHIGDGASEWSDVNVQDRVQHSDFTIFLPNTVTIKAFANGGDSGMAAVYYQFVPETEHYDMNGPWELLGKEGVHLAPDGKYHLYFKAIDIAGNVTYFSGKSVILDDTAPEKDVAITDANLSKHGFFYGDVTLNIHIAEPALGESEAFAGLKNISYRVLRDGEVTQDGQLWPSSGTTSAEQERVLTWDGQLIVQSVLNNSNNVAVEITVTDMAGNVTTYNSATGDIKIDMTAPEILGFYDRNDTVDSIFAGCFIGNRHLTISVNELNFIPEESFIHVVDTDTGREETYQWTSLDTTHIAAIAIINDGHYTVTAEITDAAGNTTNTILFAEDTVAAEAFIIDNTPSDIKVSYDNNDAQNENYFATARTLTVTVTERNFDPARMSAIIHATLENSGNRETELFDWHSDGNVHTATIKLDKDGIYRLTVTGQDALGNTANDTSYTGTAPRHWVLDTYMNEPVIESVINEGAYNGPVVPQITVADTNLEDITITMIRTRLNEIDVDVTDLLLTEDKLLYENTTGGKKISLDIFPLEQGMDGEYTITVDCIDKAGNTASNAVSFYVNRYGSVYVYDDYLASLIGGYFTGIEEDIVITEYNPSGVEENTSRVQITVDGIPVREPVFEVTTTEDGKQGESGWYEYRYTIAKENFIKDGVYDVVISSKDTAGNVPENTSEDLAIRFAVDTTAPELPSITGLENAIVKANSITVNLSAMDNVLLDSITVYLNGEVLEKWTDIGSYDVKKTFEVPAGLEHTVRIVVTDKTGGTLDTDAEAFAPSYNFNRTITVSTNFFLRLYADKMLFGVSVTGATILLVGSIIGIIILFKKRKNDNEA